jgi:hypothetical protein
MKSSLGGTYKGIFIRPLGPLPPGLVGRVVRHLPLLSLKFEGGGGGGGGSGPLPSPDSGPCGPGCLWLEPCWPSSGGGRPWSCRALP